MSAFDLFRSSVPKLVCTYPIPLTSKSNLWCGTDTQPVPRFVISLRSALVRPPGVRRDTSPAVRPSLFRDVTGAFLKDSFPRD